MKRILVVTIFCAALCLAGGPLLSHSEENDAPAPSPTPLPPPAVEIWKDPGSGLTWQVTPTGGMMNWAAAQAHCDNLRLGNYRDWRLPTLMELRGLVRGCPVTRIGGACGVTGRCLQRRCANVACKGCEPKKGPGADGNYWPAPLAGEGWWYWSSSPVTDVQNGAWGVYFHIGGVGAEVMDADYRVRCVRP